MNDFVSVRPLRQLQVRVLLMGVLLSMAAIPSLAFQTVASNAENASPAAPEAEAAKPVITPEMRGDIMMARKQFREAIDYYRPGADKSAVLANKTGIAYHQMLDLNNAEKWYKKATKLNSQYAEAWNNLGTVHYAQKSYRRAIQEYKKALKVNPDSASIMVNLGTAYFARKQYNDASKAYQAALVLDPEVFERRGATTGTTIQQRAIEERAKFHYYLSKTYAKAGERDRAIQYMRMSLEEGFKDKSKYLKDPEFASLQEDPEFVKLLNTEQKVL